MRRLAENLEKEAKSWKPVDRSQNPSPDVEDMESKRWSHVLWNNAAEAGVVLFELCGWGAFDEQPRVKNLICQIRAEIKALLQEFEVPWEHKVVNLRYGPPQIRKTYDVYFVKLFEGFCNVWATSFEDHRLVESYYLELKEKAKVHAKLMNDLGVFLRAKFAENRA